MIESPLKTYAAAVLTMILLSMGQVLLKVLASKLFSNGMTLAGLRHEATMLFWLTSGVLATYVVVIALWLYVLKSLDLNRAFAFASLTFVFVPLFSYFFLYEKITIGMVAGALLIIGGILVSANF